MFKNNYSKFESNDSNKLMQIPLFRILRNSLAVIMILCFLGVILGFAVSLSGNILGTLLALVFNTGVIVCTILINGMYRGI